MKTTREGRALYLHCLPADINGVSCVDGEVGGRCFDRYRTPSTGRPASSPILSPP